jgi:hypothetical protein
MKNKIDNIKKLSINDKNILLNAYILNNIELCKNMSIFSTMGEYKSYDNYNYFETTTNESIYYINMYFSTLLCLFIDKEKKILYYSRYFFDKSCFIHFINHIDIILTLLDSIKLDDSQDIGTDIISIQKWFVTYGHYKDEIFNLCDFYNKKQSVTNTNYKILLDYHTDNNVVTNYPYNINYTIIDKLLFEKNNSINSYSFNKQVLKMSKLYLIEHIITSNTFHSFPINITKKILSGINDNIHYEKVFITRNNAVHLPRDLDNINDIEKYVKTKNYICINPEVLLYIDFIASIRNANNIITTWGGALTNLIYLRHSCNVIILQSKSYEHESIELFNKIIETYKLNIIIIKHKNNKIDLNELNKI